MHSNQFKPEMFDISIDGEPGTLSGLFPDWNRYDRFGIVIHEAWGAVGASLLLQAATAEFFRARQAAGISDIYPEVYAFHVGRDTGDLSMYDVWPFWKEVIVERNPARVLQALCDRGITHLAVPSGPVQPFDFIWPEKIAARDRIRSVIAYSADGKTEGANIEIRSDNDQMRANTHGTLHIDEVIQEWKDTELEDARRWIGYVISRELATTPAEIERARELHQAKLVEGVCIEQYRRENLKYGLARLVP